MKNALYDLVASINLLVLSAVKTIAEFLIFLNGQIGWTVLKSIDENRLLHAEAATIQQSEISELDVLFSITAVRNDAVVRGKWNEGHEDTLNVLGNVLANEHDWEVEDVERYLHEVIATGPLVNQEE
jgi:hypothetical protein